MRSKLIWVSLIAVLIVGTVVYVTLPSEKQSSPDEPTRLAGKRESRPSATSKSTRRLDFGKAEKRDGLLYGPGDEKPFTGVLDQEHSAGGRQAQIPVRDGVIDGVMKTFDLNGTLRVRAEYENGKLVSKREWDKDGVELNDDGDSDPFDALLATREAERQGPAPLPNIPKPILDGPNASGGIEISELQEQGGVAYRTGTRVPYTGRAHRRLTDGSRWERNYENGKRHGEFKYYFPNGHVQSREYYVNGKKDGVYTMYYEDGQKRYEAEIDNGKQIGIATSWNQQGQVVSRWEYTEDGQRINLQSPTPPSENSIPASPVVDEPASANN